MSPFELTATMGRTHFQPGEPIPALITLRNTSTSTIWVNRRLGVGYEDNIEREIYFTVSAENGAVLPVPDEERVDVHRTALERRDFAPLDPDAAIETTLNIAAWYPFRKAGLYRIVFTYENRRDGKEFGVEAFCGIVNSDPLSIDIER